MKRLWFAIILALIFLVLYAFRVISGYWLGMLSAIFIVLGLALTVLFAGAGATSTEGATTVGVILLLVGIILALIIFFIPV